MWVTVLSVRPQDEDKGKRIDPAAGHHIILNAVFSRELEEFIYLLGFICVQITHREPASSLGAAAGGKTNDREAQFLTHTEQGAREGLSQLRYPAGYVPDAQQEINFISGLNTQRPHSPVANAAWLQTLALPLANSGN